MTNQLDLPQSFDSDIYKSSNQDLLSLADEALLQHYELHGRSEGRVASSIVSRHDFVDLIPAGLNVLEIGPFDSPCVVGEHVDYLDLLSQEELRERAIELNRNPDGVPVIRWVAGNGRLDCVSVTYDVLFSCHNIEHQFDLVDHLEQAASALSNHGYYFLIVPDSRYCFDHFLRTSTIADVLDAHEQKRFKHSLKSVIEHRALTTHNDPVRHWASDHTREIPNSRTVDTAIQEFRSTDEILDVHAWQFTPDSLSEILNCLSELELIQLRTVRIYPTLRNTFEFMVILQKTLS